MTSRSLFTFVLLPILSSSLFAGSGPTFLDLYYAGEPLKTQSTPSITCRDNNQQRWIDAGITQEPGGSFRMQPQPTGKYLLHIEIDENTTNPARYAGDYDVFQEIEITPTSPNRIRVNLNKIIRLTAPWDTAQPLKDMLTRAPDQKPSFDTPKYSLRHRAPMTFTWEPLAEGAVYSYVVLESGADGRGPDVVRSTTKETTVTLSLPPTLPGRYYEFSLAAKLGEQNIGDFLTHDAGVQGWTCHFRVVNKSLPLWIYGVGLVAIGLLIWGGLQVPPEKRIWLAGGVLACAIIGLAWHAGHRGALKKSQEHMQQVQAELQAERAKQGESFLAELDAAVAKPAWWDGVEPELPIHTLGDLMSVWQSGGTVTRERGRRFYKSAYQAVHEHPEDPDLVPEALQLMSSVADDPAVTLALKKFWVDKFFYYKQRTDNCANCKTGDATGFVLRDLAYLYLPTEPDKGIALIERLLKERETEVSDYNWALMFEALSKLRWEKGDKNQAIADIHEGLRRFPSGWQADQLRKTLQRYQEGPPSQQPTQGIIPDENAPVPISKP